MYLNLARLTLLLFKFAPGSLESVEFDELKMLIILLYVTVYLPYFTHYLSSIELYQMFYVLFTDVS